VSIRASRVTISESALLVWKVPVVSVGFSTQLKSPPIVVWEGGGKEEGGQFGIKKLFLFQFVVLSRMEHTRLLALGHCTQLTWHARMVAYGRL